jgi:hypothetical protein
LSCLWKKYFPNTASGGKIKKALEQINSLFFRPKMHWLYNPESDFSAPSYRKINFPIPHGSPSKRTWKK